MVGLLSGALVALSVPLSGTDTSVKPDFEDQRGVWEGWGTSICWWGNGVGGSQYQELFADLLFTRKRKSLLGKQVPGLGLNLARYNIGGCGDADRRPPPSNLPWFRAIRGFWDGGSRWDWSRDANQRAMTAAAHKRGARIEMFSNAPEWWMTSEKSSCGGKLEPQYQGEFAAYLATVVKKAESDWGLKVDSIEPFNEPAAGWWGYPHNQEGCNIAPLAQAAILGHLRHELDTRGLQKMAIAASDENSMGTALETANYLKANAPAAFDAIAQVNVHSYNGLAAWSDDSVRAALHEAVAGKRIWSSEFGDPDGSGMTLAKVIVSDINFLRPTAWVYWQAVEPASAWGLLNAQFGKAEDERSPERAQPLAIHNKYFVFAQFTRFLRPGMKVIGSSDANTVVGYDAKARRLTFITLNRGPARSVGYDLSGLSGFDKRVSVTVTTSDGTKELEESRRAADGMTFTVPMDAESVASVIVSGVRVATQHERSVSW